MLAYAGPSRPHTCVSGLPGHGGWGGQRSPLWATATGPGLFRSLGFRNPSGYWLLRRSTYSHTRGGKAGRRRGACIWCGCVCRSAVPWGGSKVPQKAAARMAAQLALAVKEVVPFPGSVGPPTDPFEYRTREMGGGGGVMCAVKDGCAGRPLGTTRCRRRLRTLWASGSCTRTSYWCQHRSLCMCMCIAQGMAMYNPGYSTWRPSGRASRTLHQQYCLQLFLYGEPIATRKPVAKRLQTILVSDAW